MPRKSFATLMICLLLLASGCARKTQIFSEPSGARVFVDGKEVCTTPCTYEYKTGSSGTTYALELHKEGFDPLFHRMSADEVDREARSSLWTAGLVIPGGSLLWIGSLFTNKLKESYHFELREEPPVVAWHGPADIDRN